MAVEEKIGVVTDYLNRIGVAVIWLTDGDVRRGDQVRIAGRTTELTQAVESLEIDHRPVEEALRGSEVAMKIADPVRRHDQVFRITVEKPSVWLCLEPYLPAVSGGAV
jgi:translation initiation factor IF-2